MTEATPQNRAEQQTETPLEAAAGPSSETLHIPDALPVLPLRGGTVVFPLAVVPLDVGQPRSVKLVDDVMRGNRMVALVPQRNDGGTGEQPDDLHPVGTAAIIHQLLRAPDGAVRLSCRVWSGFACSIWSPASPTWWRGSSRLRIRHGGGRDRGAAASGARSLPAAGGPDPVNCPTNWSPPPRSLTDPRQVAYLVASTTPARGAARQEILELEPVDAKLRRLVEILQHEESVRELGQNITTETQERMTKSQREYYLREQLRSIQQELGGDEDDPELADLRRRIEEANLPEEARREADRELERLASIPCGLAGARHYPDLPRLDRKSPLGHAQRRRDRRGAGASRCSTKTTTTWRRSRTASWSTWRCASCARSARRSEGRRGRPRQRRGRCLRRGRDRA